MNAGGRGRLGVAAFDFDKTLVDRHTMLRFLLHARGPGRLAAALVFSASRVRTRDALKVAAVGAVFKGMETERLAEAGVDYARALSHALRPQMLARLRMHQQRGHATVIVSAGLGVYLRPFARELGIDEVLAVELVSDASGRLTGEVVGGVNTRGPEKLRRLNGWLLERFGSLEEVELWAYGDDVGDREMLAAADHPMWVGDPTNT